MQDSHTKPLSSKSEAYNENFGGESACWAHMLDDEGHIIGDGNSRSSGVIPLRRATETGADGPGKPTDQVDE